MTTKRSEIADKKERFLKFLNSTRSIKIACFKTGISYINDYSAYRRRDKLFANKVDRLFMLWRSLERELELREFHRELSRPHYGASMYFIRK